jgi:hypothetical protein
MGRQIGILISLLATSLVCFADSSIKLKLEDQSLGRKSYKAIPFGHNVTPTSYTLSKGTSTAGIYAIGYGFTDSLTVATSPWIEYNYNMHNLHLRYGGQVASEQRLTLGLSYFKSYEARDAYEQESTTAQLIHSVDVSPVYTLHTALSYMYYFNDQRPYSLRMASFNSDPFELIFSTLHEARLSEHLGLCGEIGMLGLNYFYPYVHYGASFSYIQKNWFVQIGVSHTFHPGTQYNGRSTTYLSNEKATDAVHPEIYTQVYF